MVQEKTADVPVVRQRPAATFTEQLIEPISRLRDEVDRLFSEFPMRWPALRVGRALPAMLSPAVDITETDEAYKVSVEVPGMEAKEVEVSVDDTTLVISGEKKEEREEKKKGYYLSERQYGSFERRIALPSGADAGKIKATTKDGVLEITLPKTEQAKQAKRKIPIQAA